MQFVQLNFIDYWSSEGGIFKNLKNLEKTCKNEQKCAKKTSKKLERVWKFLKNTWKYWKNFAKLGKKLIAMAVTATSFQWINFNSNDWIELILMGGNDGRTSAVFVADVGESPDVAQVDGEADDGQ